MNLLDLDYEVPLDVDLDQFGIGVIGAGFIIRDCHLVAYQQAGFRVLGIASRNPQRAEEVALLRGIPRAYQHYRELLDNPEIQILDIGVPPQHQPGIIRDVARGRPKASHEGSKYDRDSQGHHLFAGRRRSRRENEP